jgi:hypothetical protein
MDEHGVLENVSTSWNSVMQTQFLFLVPMTHNNQAISLFSPVVCFEKHHLK